MTENPFAGQGSVLLDIGGDIGALVVIMPAGLEGIEVEIAPRDESGAADLGGHDHHRDHGDHDHHHDEHDHGDHDHDHGSHRPHVAVVNRPTQAGQVPSLVFPELVEGDYVLYRRPAGPVELTVSIVGGQVTEVAWPV